MTKPLMKPPTKCSKIFETTTNISKRVYIKQKNFKHEGTFGTIDSAYDLDYKNNHQGAGKEKRCNSENDMQATILESTNTPRNIILTRRDVHYERNKKLCTVCKETPKCKKYNKCEQCQKFCQDFDPTTENSPEENNTPQLGSPFISSRFGGTNDDKPNPQSFTKFHNIATLYQGPTLDAVMTLLNVNLKDQIDQMLVLVKYKSDRDYAQTPEIFKSSLNHLEKSGKQQDKVLSKNKVDYSQIPNDEVSSMNNLEPSQMITNSLSSTNNLEITRQAADQDSLISNLEPAQVTRAENSKNNAKYLQANANEVSLTNNVDTSQPAVGQDSLVRNSELSQRAADQGSSINSSDFLQSVIDQVSDTNNVSSFQPANNLDASQHAADQDSLMHNFEPTQVSTKYDFESPKPTSDQDYLVDNPVHEVSPTKNLRSFQPAAYHGSPTLQVVADEVPASKNQQTFKPSIDQTFLLNNLEPLQIATDKVSDINNLESSQGANQGSSMSNLQPSQVVTDEVSSANNLESSQSAANLGTSLNSLEPLHVVTDGVSTTNNLKDSQLATDQDSLMHDLELTQVITDKISALNDLESPKPDSYQDSLVDNLKSEQVLKDEVSATKNLQSSKPNIDQGSLLKNVEAFQEATDEVSAIKNIESSQLATDQSTIVNTLNPAQVPIDEISTTNDLKNAKLSTDQNSSMRNSESFDVISDDVPAMQSFESSQLTKQNSKNKVLDTLSNNHDVDGNVKNIAFEDRNSVISSREQNSHNELNTNQQIDTDSQILHLPVKNTLMPESGSQYINKETVQSPQEIINNSFSSIKNEGIVEDNNSQNFINHLEPHVAFTSQPFSENYISNVTMKNVTNSHQSSESNESEEEVDNKVLNHTENIEVTSESTVTKSENGNKSLNSNESSESVEDYNSNMTTTSTTASEYNFDTFIASTPATQFLSDISSSENTVFARNEHSDGEIDEQNLNRQDEANLTNEDEDQKKKLVNVFTKIIKNDLQGGEELADIEDESIQKAVSNLVVKSIDSDNSRKNSYLIHKSLNKLENAIESAESNVMQKEDIVSSNILENEHSQFSKIEPNQNEVLNGTVESSNNALTNEHVTEQNPQTLVTKDKNILNTTADESPIEGAYSNLSNDTLAERNTSETNDRNSTTNEEEVGCSLEDTKLLPQSDYNARPSAGHNLLNDNRLNKMISPLYGLLHAKDNAISKIKPTKVLDLQNILPHIDQNPNYPPVEEQNYPNEVISDADEYNNNKENIPGLENRGEFMENAKSSSSAENYRGMPEAVKTAIVNNTHPNWPEIVGATLDWAYHTETEKSTTADNGFNYFGKLFPANDKSNVVGNTNKQMDKQVYFIGNGIKLPLHMKQDKDGSLQLTVDIEKLCNCKEKTCNNGDEDNKSKATSTIGNNDGIENALSARNSKQKSTVQVQSNLIQNNGTSIDTQFSPLQGNETNIKNKQLEAALEKEMFEESTAEESNSVQNSNKIERKRRQLILKPSPINFSNDIAIGYRTATKKNREENSEENNESIKLLKKPFNTANLFRLGYGHEKNNFIIPDTNNKLNKKVGFIQKKLGLVRDVLSWMKNIANGGGDKINKTLPLF